MALNKNVSGIYFFGHKLALVFGDVVMLALSMVFASKLRLERLPQFLTLESIGIILISISCLFLAGSYTSSNVSRRPKLPLKTLLVVLTSAIPGVLFIYILGPERFTALLGRGVYPIALVMFSVLALLNHLLMNVVFFEETKGKHILVLGNTQALNQLGSILKNHTSKLEIRHSQALLKDSIEKQQLLAIVISPEHNPTNEEQQQLLELRISGLPIYSVSDFFETFFFLVPVGEIDNEWFIRSQGFLMLHSSAALRIKRLLDVLCSILLFLLSLPLCLLIIAIIKLGSSGPILFSQTRIGLEGKPFRLFKFRTMYENAEVDGAKWADDNDSRIIPFGNFLRKSRIDELPQCWNILKGEMSIIGPRPERPEFTAMLAKDIPYYDLRNIVKPGLTGWAQVSYPYGASIDDALRKLQYDFYYIKNYSLGLDLNILLRTILVTLRRSGR